MNNDTTTRNIAIAALSWNITKERWHAAICLPASGHGFPQGDDTLVMVAYQEEKVPWRSTMGRPLRRSDALGDTVQARRYGFAPSGDGSYGRVLRRVALIELDEVDYNALQAGKAPSHRTRRIFLDWRAKIEAGTLPNID